MRQWGKWKTFPAVLPAVCHYPIALCRILSSLRALRPTGRTRILVGRDRFIAPLQTKPKSDVDFENAAGAIKRLRPTPLPPVVIRAPRSFHLGRSTG